MESEFKKYPIDGMSGSAMIAKFSSELIYRDIILL